MKVKSVPPKSEFKKIRIEITIESENELAYLWAINNSGYKHIEELAAEYPGLQEKALDCLRWRGPPPLFDYIDKLATGINLKK
jgi:hypothetical protein